MPFVAERVDDMLRIYGDKAVLAEQVAAEKIGQQPSSFLIEHARHRGECLAWAVHDSYFMWERPLSNTYDELRAYVCGSDAGPAELAVRDWSSLRAYTVERSVSFLGRLDYPPNPIDLHGEHHTRWWMYMAIIHECDRQLGK